MSRTRTWVVGVCLVLTWVLAPLAAAATWLRVDLLHRSGFASHVDTALDDDRVQAELANQIVAQVTVPSSRASAADRALLAEVTRTVLATGPLRAALRTSVGHLHTQLVAGDSPLELDLRRPVDRLRDTLTTLDPRLAALLPADRDLTPVVVATRHDAPELWLAVTVAWHLQFLLPLAALGAGALAVLLARRRSHELAIAAAGAALACMLLLAALRVTHARIRGSITTNVGRGALDGVWSAFGSPLVRDLRVGALLGLLVAGTTALLSARSRRRRLRRPAPAPQATR